MSVPIFSVRWLAIEKQTIQWLAEFIGLGPGYGGILMSGGNMANFNAFLAARTAKAPKNLKEDGLAKIDDLVLYCSKATHTWIEKAAVLFGHGSKAIRWIATDTVNRMKTDVLAAAIQEDLRNGKKPFLVIGTAGDVSTGAVDDFSTIAKYARIMISGFTSMGRTEFLPQCCRISGHCSKALERPIPSRSIRTSGCTLHWRWAARW